MFQREEFELVVKTMKEQEIHGAELALQMYYKDMNYRKKEEERIKEEKEARSRQLDHRERIVFF